MATLKVSEELRMTFFVGKGVEPGGSSVQRGVMSRMLLRYEAKSCCSL